MLYRELTNLLNYLDNISFICKCYYGKGIIVELLINDVEPSLTCHTFKTCGAIEIVSRDLHFSFIE